MPAAARSLGDVIRDVASGSASAEELTGALLAATVYCERADGPGFRALGEPGSGVVPVFSSVEQLARARGTVRWFAVTGTDLLDLLPPGYDLLLDMGGPAPLRLQPGALTRRVEIEVQRRASA
jgi:hypothetical protein